MSCIVGRGSGDQVCPGFRRRHPPSRDTAPATRARSSVRLTKGVSARRHIRQPPLQIRNRRPLAGAFGDQVEQLAGGAVQAILGVGLECSRPATARASARPRALTISEQERHSPLDSTFQAPRRRRPRSTPPKFRGVL